MLIGRLMKIETKSGIAGATKEMSYSIRTGWGHLYSFQGLYITKCSKSLAAACNFQLGPKLQTESILKRMYNG